MAKKEKTPLELFFEFINKIYKMDFSLCENHDYFWIKFENNKFVIEYPKAENQIYNEHLSIEDYSSASEFPLWNFIKRVKCVKVNTAELNAFRRTVKSRLKDISETENTFTINFTVAVDSGEETINEKGKTVKVKVEEEHSLSFSKTEYIPETFDIEEICKCQLNPLLVEEDMRIIRIFLDNNQLNTEYNGKKIFSSSNNNLNGKIKNRTETCNYEIAYGIINSMHIIKFISNGNFVKYYQYFRVIF